MGADFWVPVLVALLGSGVITSIVGFISTRRKNSIEADVLVSGEWQKLYREMEKRLKEAEAEIKETKLALELVQGDLAMLIGWVNDYTPALKEAGIDPPDVDNIQFRGE